MMEGYEKPVVLANEELAEGVYAASGESASSGTVKCESVYMNWTWQRQKTTDWDNSQGYKYNFGCNGCRAYRSNGCGLLTDYPESGYASSYEDDIGSYKPTWEQKGYDPDGTITDWDC